MLELSEEVGVKLFVLFQRVQPGGRRSCEACCSLASIPSQRQGKDWPRCPNARDAGVGGLDFSDPGDMAELIALWIAFVDFARMNKAYGLRAECLPFRCAAKKRTLRTSPLFKGCCSLSPLAASSSVHWKSKRTQPQAANKVCPDSPKTLLPAGNRLKKSAHSPPLTKRKARAPAKKASPLIPARATSMRPLRFLKFISEKR